MSARSWREVGLFDLVTIASGQVDPRLPEYRDLPLIAPDHIESGTGRLLEVRTASQQKAISGKYLVEPGDVIYSKIRPYLQKAHRATFRALCSADMYPLRPRAGIDGDFILNLLLSEPFTNFAVSTSTRSGIPKINRVELAEFRTTVPSADEQHRIGGFLKSADRLIASLELFIAKKRDIRQGLMQELLAGSVRLPSCGGTWRETNLGAVAQIKTGRRNNQDRVDGGAYPFFVRSATVERIDSYSYECEAILVPGEGGIGSIFHYINGKFEVHQRVYKISDFRGVHGRFIYYFMRQYFGAHAMENTVKATVDSLRLPTFKSFRLWIPSELEEQRAIADVLMTADAEIAALERRLESAQAIKQGMMQELLTGRTRLVGERVAA